MSIKAVICSFLLIILALNFFIRLIQYFRQSSKLAFSKETQHSFLCTNCNERYELNGQETKKLVKFSPKKEINSPKKSKIMYKFTCPKCNEYAYQEKVFDSNVVRGFGTLRLKGDNSQIELFKDAFIKGILPAIIGGIMISSLF